MASKKRLLILTGFLFLNVFLLGITSAQGLCWVETSASTCTATTGNQVVMYLSNSTNAHGELKSPSPQYEKVLCCDFGSGDTSCSANNKIIGLSSPTNAHAETPEGLNYNSNVCYDSLISCFPVSAGFNCAGAPLELEVLSLSSSTNAHIEGPGLPNYNTKICCVVVNAFWSDDNFVEINLLNVVPDLTSVKLVLEDSGFAENTSLNFDIFDSVDTSIRTVVGIADSNGKVVATWLITSGDLTTATDSEKFYFVVDGKQSGFLTLNILPLIDCTTVITCSDYEQSICESDVCQVAEVGMPVDCSDPDIDCFCALNVNTTCSGAYSSSVTLPPSPPKDDDGIISVGETCDSNGNNWGPIIGCTDFDNFTGGNLSCDSTGHFDTSLCTGGTPGGICGDNTINTGETCDNLNWGPITGCSDFDGFTGAGLLCDDLTCNFNTFLCNVVETTEKIGTCSITQEDIDPNGCDDDGLLTISWTGEWTWGEGNSDQNDPDGLASSCTAGGGGSIECPAQIRLPFFGFYNIA